MLLASQNNPSVEESEKKQINGTDVEKGVPGRKTERKR